MEHSWIFLFSVQQLFLFAPTETTSNKRCHFPTWNANRQIIHHFIFPISLLLLTWPTLVLHATRSTKCACTPHVCTNVCEYSTHYSSYVSSSLVAAGEIYEVLRTLACSQVMGDWFALLASLYPCLTLPDCLHLKTHKHLKIHIHINTWLRLYME